MGRPSREIVYQRLANAMRDLTTIGGLPKQKEAEPIWRGIWYEEVHNSTAIEGNTLILKEVQTLLADGRAVGARELREYLEVQSYADAAKWVYQQATGADWQPHQRLSITELRYIHRLSVEPVWLQFPPDHLDPNEGPGSFRRHDIREFHAAAEPPPWTEVPQLITDWLTRADSDPWEANRHTVEHLAQVHAEFEKIHPFRDGNGRVGRLVVNLLLVRHGYPPCVIYNRDRKRYLSALRKADIGDCGPLGELLARAITNSIERFILPTFSEPHQLLPLTALTQKQITHNALLLAARRGRLRAVQRNGRWYSTREYVQQYRHSRNRH